MEMALRTSNLRLPEGFVEMDREEMMYVDGGDYFVGISVSAATAIFLWNSGQRTVGLAYGGLSVLALGKMAISMIGFDVYLAPYISAITSALSTIPVVGIIAIGIVAIATAAIYGTILYAGSKGRGVKIGVNVKTGWFGIPKGANFVCGLI